MLLSILSVATLDGYKCYLIFITVCTTIVESFHLNLKSKFYDFYRKNLDFPWLFPMSVGSSQKIARQSRKYTFTLHFHATSLKNKDGLPSQPLPWLIIPAGDSVKYSTGHVNANYTTAIATYVVLSRMVSNSRIAHDRGNPVCTFSNVESGSINKFI